MKKCVYACVTVCRSLLMRCIYTYYCISLSVNSSRGTALHNMNIPPKQLKEVIDIIDKPLQGIWNEEILLNKKFPSKLTQ